jgi:hypothetical protein
VKLDKTSPYAAAAAVDCSGAELRHKETGGQLRCVFEVRGANLVLVIALITLRQALFIAARQTVSSSCLFYSQTVGQNGREFEWNQDGKGKKKSQLDLIEPISAEDL